MLPGALCHSLAHSLFLQDRETDKGHVSFPPKEKVDFGSIEYLYDVSPPSRIITQVQNKA